MLFIDLHQIILSLSHYIKAPPPDRLREGDGRAADYWGI